MEELKILFEQNTVIGVLIAIFGGIVVRWLDKTLRQNTDYFVQAAQIRDELRSEITMLQEMFQGAQCRISELEKELAEWKKKYYDLLDSQITRQGPN